ncbi:MAG: hypothetical protein BWY65_01493 [Firmicutes bacterium ADurb.Bin373]|nr:MAG: hypothetical protein BWY65_01493 [Firmicutes bacterium ADurb.Bin373]
MAGVGMIPTCRTLTPAEQMPATMAASSMSPDIRVSLPMTILVLALSLARINAPARPNLKASPGVSSRFATPLTPSVPNITPMKRSPSIRRITTYYNFG